MNRKASKIKAGYFPLLIGIMLFLGSCEGGLNLFSIEDDKELGRQLSEEIASDPVMYPVLDENQYPLAYNIVRDIRDKILNSGKVTYRTEFEWEVKIIRDDSILNAFAAPGGYIYIYTGLIKFLDTEDELAGVLAHEIAHADKRHSTEQMTKAYSLSFLLDIVLGDYANLADIAEGLVNLKFSRSNEAEADEYSVNYLCPTDYNAAGAAGFFQQLIDMGQAGGTPQFLSTHPSPDNRVADIQNHKQMLGCDGNETNPSRYDDLKNSLP